MGILKGKIAIVTGASRSQGIGSAICLRLAEAGADIFFTHWSNYDENEGVGVDEGYPTVLSNQIKNMGVRCHHMEIDLSKLDAPTNILNRTEETLGVASVLVNNATYEKLVDFRTLTAEVLDRHYQINNSGPILLSTEFAKRFEKAFPGKSGGRIINLVSKGPDPNNLAYIASKGMIIALTEPLSVGLAPIGITVNSVDPGPTDSGWMDKSTKASLSQLFPTGNVGTPDDAARLVKFLASDESAWITGQVIKSEGGFLGR
ncbi:SDR family oxidoreductase [Sporosarcina thermotolerans]|uniref:SDR family oxidoreductase n=1 Tax=Sporosarcina thermotolerans TaxID=633404 RepID=A0AAW9AGP9_9BACL|nr:SDR family oxidoreductase [Sporosarcina thermotolerans]MDW0118353.1 SDR family oxidoreductase [Sporosarcina thermotolerans]WHT49407.1 SDR family oxidoreductase [Sporosarcina thermotolerans]